MSEQDPVEAAAADYTAPAPEPVPFDDPEPEELPADQDTFPRDYVEKLRAEAAKHRTRARDIESAFDGYTPSEKERFLELATKLSKEPEAALDEFRGVTERLARQLGKEPFTVSEPVNLPPDPAVQPEATPEPAPAPTAALTAEDVERLVAERIEAERLAAENEAKVNQTLAEVEGLGDAYASKAGKAFLLALAQEANTDLEGAHAIHQDLLNQVREEAVREYREGLRSGQHPPRLPSGDSTTPTAQGPPKTLQEARARMEERFRATYEE